MTNVKNDQLLRTLLGFGDLFTNAMAGTAGFPPFDVESVGDSSIRVSVAAAGFSPDDLSVELDGSELVIRGVTGERGEGRKFLHRGIARRDFTRKFLLAEGWEVSGADHEDGVLTVSLTKREPEKPETVKIEISRKG